MAKSKFKRGDIVYLRTKASRNQYIGVVLEISMPGFALIKFHKCVDKIWIGGAPMQMSDDSLTYVGEIPFWTEWDV